MNFPFYIAKRYLYSRSKNNAINIITGIASFGIIVGATALFVVLSVFSGLRVFSLSFSNDFDPDLKVFPKSGKTFLINETQKKEIQQTKGITFYSKVIEEKALFLYQNKEHVAEIKGVDAQYPLVNKVNKTLYQGQWLVPKTPQVVVGNGIAQKLSMGLFDLNNDFEIFMPKPGKGAITNPDEAFNKSDIIPVGIYAISDDLDSKYVFADLTLTQELLSYQPNQISALEIKIDSLANEAQIVDHLNQIFKQQVVIKNRAALNDSLHKMLNTENTAIYLIFTLVIIMTLFTLAGAIIMMILDKQHNLKTLLNLGTPITAIRRIFLLQGTLLTFIGGIIGIVIGIVSILVQQHYHIIMITESLPYPVEFNFQNIVIVLMTILILGFTASYIASSRVSKKLLE